MNVSEHEHQQRLARIVGISLITSIIVGILASVFITHGININLSADVEATARNMLDAEMRVRAKAYLSVFNFVLESLVILGLYRLVQRHGQLLAGLSFLVGLAGAVLVLTGAVFTMNVAELVSAPAYSEIAAEQQRLMLTALQVSSDYTSFHLGLVMSAAGKAGFFYLLLRSSLLPKLISGWGLFASLFVAVTIVARDFLPLLGNNVITLAFMVSNLIALVSTGLYMAIYGVRSA